MMAQEREIISLEELCLGVLGCYDYQGFQRKQKCIC